MKNVSKIALAFCAALTGANAYSMAKPASSISFEKQADELVNKSIYAPEITIIKNKIISSEKTIKIAKDTLKANMDNFVRLSKKVQEGVDISTANSTSAEILYQLKQHILNCAKDLDVLITETAALNEELNKKTTAISKL